MDDFPDFATILLFVVIVVTTFFLSVTCFDSTIEKAELAQAICIKYNSKAVSFDRLEVTCENKAVIPLKEQ